MRTYGEIRPGNYFAFKCGEKERFKYKTKENLRQMTECLGG
jgi:hypothetical protein